MYASQRKLPASDAVRAMRAGEADPTQLALEAWLVKMKRRPLTREQRQASSASLLPAYGSEATTSSQRGAAGEKLAGDGCRKELRALQQEDRQTTTKMQREIEELQEQMNQATDMIDFMRRETGVAHGQLRENVDALRVQASRKDSEVHAFKAACCTSLTVRPSCNAIAGS
eukprot:TRINITY_DN30919_c0_g1_i1.p1 TRINITY_DN30919_c0_g1~~TRINITY_DN30919_c0_g1_i1.p1  ORF type:complete len:186 (-),score=38.33 TRINITY_DN30919_c0_g1_i1:65-577(-)